MSPIVPPCATQEARICAAIRPLPWLSAEIIAAYSSGCFSPVGMLSMKTSLIPAWETFLYVGAVAVKSTGIEMMPSGCCWIVFSMSAICLSTWYSAEATPVTATPYLLSVSVMPCTCSWDQSRLTVCIEMPTLKWPALILAPSASVSLRSSGDAAFSPCGPWPTIEVGPSVARSTPLTQEAGTSAPLAPGNRAIDPRAKTLVSKALDPGMYLMGFPPDIVACRSSVDSRPMTTPPRVEVGCYTKAVSLAFRESDGGDDDRALDDQLHRRADAEQHQAIVERPDDQAAEQGAQNEAAPAEQAATAEYDRGDDVELHALHDVRARRMRSRRQDQSGQAGQHPRQDERNRGDTVDVYPGVESRRRVAARRVDLPAIDAVVQKQNSGGHCRQRPCNWRRHSGEATFAEYCKIRFVGNDYGLGVGDQHRQAAGGAQRSERDQERGNRQSHGQQAIDQPDQGTRADARHRANDPIVGDIRHR